MPVACFEEFAKRVSRLDNSFSSNRKSDREYATINLLNFWSEFCGEFLLLSVNGDFTTLSGTTIVRSSNESRVTLETKLRVHMGGGRANWFANYHVSSSMVGYVRHLAPQNSGTIISSVGATNNCSAEIRCLRNYFAHKNHNTIAKVWANFGKRDPLSILDDTVSHQSRWKDWSRSLLLVAEACAH